MRFLLLNELGSVGLVFAVMSLLVQPAYGETQVKEIETATEKKSFSVSAADLLAQQPAVSIIEVTGVKINSTEKGIEVVLESSNPTQLQPASTAQKPQPKPETETPAKKPSQDDVIELVVTGEQNQGYNPDNAAVGTRTDTSVRDVPQSIQVVPREVIEDQNATNVTEALRNVPGVVPGSASNLSVFDAPVIRGFGGGINDLFRRNGLRDPLGTSVSGETANVERIEVLRGPASVLYGQGSLGGTVNIVTKQPLGEPFYEVEGSIGNYNLYRGNIDFSGPLNETGNFKYRLNVAAETGESFVDFYDRQRFQVSPVLAWKIGDNTDLTVEAEYLNLDNPNYFGLPAVGTILDNPNGDIPRSVYVGGREDEGKEIDLYRIGYNLEHRFSENWRIRNAFNAGFRRSSSEFAVFARSLESDNRTLERSYFDSRDGFDINAYTLDTYTVGNFNTGNIKHKLVAGVELNREETTTTNGAFGFASSLDLFDPDYSSITFEEPIARFDDKETKDGLGIYIQDQISFSDSLIVVLGGRFDIVNVTNEDFINSTTDFQQDEAFSPRVGVVYKPIPNISLYGSYSRSFQQETGRAFDNSLFKPQRGTQYEIGVKADLNDRVSATLALYDLTRSNVLTEDPDNPGFDIQTGKQNSQGVELNLAGEISPGWKITAGYAYNDARITEDNSFDEGNRLNNAPENAFSLWTTYQIQKGSMQGLGFGLGLFYVGERQGDLANTFTVPSYLRTDAALFYQKKDFRAAINIRNLFDIDYFETAQNRLRVYSGSPLTVVGSVSWKF